MSLRVLELYCGIGGMHCALKRVGAPYEIVRAMDINPQVLEIYAFNFRGDKWSNRNILSLSATELNELNIDIIVLSPPCQPFCRTGLKMDIEDERTKSFCHLLNILPHVKFQYILLENVKGFETSTARNLLIDTLTQCAFKYQEFLLTPTVVGIPNSRLRYYLIGKKENLGWSFNTSSSIMTTMPLWGIPCERSPYKHIVQEETDLWKSRRLSLLGSSTGKKLPPDWCVGDIIEVNGENGNFSLSPDVIRKYGVAMDIVNLRSLSSCCFTSSYAKYVKGTGSIFDQGPDDESDVLTHALRYFTPKELSRLMCYPESYSFPPELTNKQLYKALGNSVNVYVISILISLLLSSN